MKGFKLAAIAAALLLGACAQAPVQAGYAGPGYGPPMYDQPMPPPPAYPVYGNPTPLVGGQVVIFERRCYEHRYEWHGGHCRRGGVVVDAEIGMPVGPVYGGEPMQPEYGRPGGYQPGPPRRVVGRPEAAQVIITEHPPGTPGQHRCWADQSPAPAGSGTGWCD